MPRQSKRSLDLGEASQPSKHRKLALEAEGLGISAPTVENHLVARSPASFDRAVSPSLRLNISESPASPLWSPISPLRPLDLYHADTAEAIEKTFKQYFRDLKMVRPDIDGQLRRLHIATLLERRLIRDWIVKDLSHDKIARSLRLQERLSISAKTVTSKLNGAISQYGLWKEEMFIRPLMEEDPKLSKKVSPPPANISGLRAGSTGREEFLRWSILGIGDDQTALLKFMYRNALAEKEQDSAFAVQWKQKRTTGPSDSMTAETQPQKPRQSHACKTPIHQESPIEDNVQTRTRSRSRSRSQACIYQSKILTPVDDAEARVVSNLRLMQFIDTKDYPTRMSDVCGVLYRCDSLADVDMIDATSITLNQIDIEVRVGLLKNELRTAIKGPKKNLTVNFELVKLEVYGWGFNEMIQLCKHHFPDVNPTPSSVSCLLDPCRPTNGPATYHRDGLTNISIGTKPTGCLEAQTPQVDRESPGSVRTSQYRMAKCPERACEECHQLLSDYR
jgi:hypothetical protein